MTELTQWGQEVKTAADNSKLTLYQVADKAGIRPQTLSSMMHARYVRADYAEFAERVNAVLGTSGIPPSPKGVSKEWRAAVSSARTLNDNMSVKELAEKAGFTRDRVSMVINGKSYDEPVIEKINLVLDINVPATAS